MRGSFRLIELIGIALLLVVLAVVGSRVSAEGDAISTGASSGNSVGEASSDVVALVKQLQNAGLTVTVQGVAHVAQLSVSGQTLSVDGETVEVFAYPDEWSAETDAAKIVPTGDDANTDISDWIDTPHLFRNDRLLVLQVGGSVSLDSTLSDLLSTATDRQGAR
ncbi:MAG TPA: hypothetical protein VHV31_12135 [Nitrolancea sp.]|nr:hypothetical protein [Nitrolancea sp.]